MPASIGVNLRVTGNCRQGSRKYMEDCFSVAYQQTEDEKDLEYAFFGIYDGHGGVEAASFAKEHLMETIIKHKNFWSDNDEDVLRAIKDGYIATHYAMWREQSKWPKTSSGLPSTAGTTASVAFIRRGKIYIGHVGDSGIILGYQEPGNPEWKAKPLTKDHKPENPEEIKRIKNCGGKVVAKSGIPRVVWNRPRIGHQGPVRRSTPIDEIPFLAVARSLGDLWSYNSQINQFIVSPNPDCSVIRIDTNVHRCLIFGTDGLFNVLSPAAAVHVVQQVEKHNECEALSDDQNKVWLNPSKLLVERALDRWHATKMRADNTSAVTLMLDPPGPPRAQVLKDRKKNLPESGLKIMTRYDDNNQQPREEETSSGSQTICPEPEENNLAKVNENVTNPPQVVPQIISKDDNCAPANTSNNTSISSSDVSSYYPLKERSFVPKSRESTSFDPREPYRLSEGGNENNTTTNATNSKTEDSTIQINEISSSNIEESTVEENSNEEKLVVKKASKRKLETEDTTQQRKSLRLSLTQKFLDESKKTPAPCTLAEEKLKKLAEEAEKLRLEKEKINNQEDLSNKKMSIAQRIIESKKTNLKKKATSRLNKKKLKNVLKTIIGKTKINPKVPPVKSLTKSLKFQDKNGQVKLTKVKNQEIIKRTTRSSEDSVKINNNEKQRDKTVNENTKVSKKFVKNKKVITGKVSNFKRQSTKTASQRQNNKDLAATSTEKVPIPPKPVKIPLKEAVKKVVKPAKTLKKNNKPQVLRETRSSQGNAQVVRSSGRKSGGGNNKCEAKENIREVSVKGVKSSSTKSKPPKKTQPTKLKTSLRQRIHDQTKTLKKTVLKKSR